MLRYYYATGSGKKGGPVPLAEVRRLAKVGELDAPVRVRAMGGDVWRSLSDAEAIAHAPPEASHIPRPTTEGRRLKQIAAALLLLGLFILGMLLAAGPPREDLRKLENGPLALRDSRSGSSRVEQMLGKSGALSYQFSDWISRNRIPLGSLALLSLCASPLLFHAGKRAEEKAQTAP